MTNTSGGTALNRAKDYFDWVFLGIGYARGTYWRHIVFEDDGFVWVRIGLGFYLKVTRLKDRSNGGDK